MSYVIVSEKYSLKPLRALLLIAAIAGDIAAVFLFFAAFAEHLLFAAAAELSPVKAHVTPKTFITEEPCPPE